MFAYHTDAGANRILNILDRESRGAVQGIEEQVLAFKWRFMGLEEAAYPRAVERLIADQLLRRSGLMLRLTRAGYARLIADDVGVYSSAVEGAGAGGPPTEFGLRQKLLGVFRSCELKAGGKLSAAELNRYWEVAHYRAADLRSGLDLLMRDGYVKVGRFSKTLFRLEEAGERYLNGRDAPDWLARQAPALVAADLHRKTIDDGLLCVLAAHSFALTPTERTERSYDVVEYLLERYEIPLHARFHGFELLHRFRYADPVHGAAALRLNDAGERLLAAADSNYVQWAVKNALREMAAS